MTVDEARAAVRALNPLLADTASESQVIAIAGALSDQASATRWRTMWWTSVALAAGYAGVTYGLPEMRRRRLLGY